MSLPSSIPHKTIGASFVSSKSNPNPATMQVGQIVFNPNTMSHSIVAPGPNGNLLVPMQGSQGMTGPMGMTGPTGPVGPPGIPGRTVLHGTSESVEVDEIIDFMKTMRKRMLVITPMFELHEKYPALKEAYENYLLIEKLVSGDQPDEE
jgi:hypothetical protein